LGNFWTLRPSIYILEFDDQPYLSSEILENFTDQLGKIMARASDIRYSGFSEFLGDNLRNLMYTDYTLHLSEALTLWTVSKRGLTFTELDPNRGNIIYEKQIQGEAIDHLYMSHRRLLEKSSILTIPYETILLDQLELMNLEDVVTEAGKISNYSEINEIIKFSNQEFKWNKLREAIEKRLKLRSEYSGEKRNEFFRNISYLLTIIFGLGGVTIFSEKILWPMWKHYGLPLPVSKELQLPFLFLIIITITIFILYLIIWRTFKK